MIRKVVYDHDGIEQSWEVGELFSAYDTDGNITRIASTDHPFDGINLWVGNQVVMTILLSSVKRIYWMKTE